MLRAVRFLVRHETRYRYSVPVVLAPHVLRLTPRPGYAMRARTLVVRPEPVERRDEIDAFGNPITRVVFNDAATDALSIESRFELDTVMPEAPMVTALETLPLPRPAADQLASYRPPQNDVDAGVAAFARALAAEVGYMPVAFVEHLCSTIHGRAQKHIRPSGEAQSAAQTLATWRGACRDFTVLFLAAARSLGLPARFCSGYQAAADTPDGRRYLHAWPEVFVPGIGWRGWDPTHGIRVTDGHVALSAAPDQADTMPVVGNYSFIGASLTSTLDFDLEIRARQSGPD
jgi:transglutaminase-like putative cysteine protease